MDFNATLTRAFAEASEPADESFVLAVSGAVARKERMAGALAWAQVIGLAIGAMAVATGVFMIFQPMLPELMASAGLSLAQAHGAVVNAQTANLSSAGAAGLTQLLFVVVALAGGAAVYRANQQQ